MSAPRSTAVDAALKLVEDGKVSSFTEAAAAAGCADSSVSKRWRREHAGDSPPFKGGGREAKADKVKEAMAKLGDKPEAEPEPTELERKLAAEVLRLKTDQSGKGIKFREALRGKRDAEDERDKLERELLLATAAENVRRPGWLVTPEPSGTHHATLVAAFSDFHIGEVVEPGEMADYNAYDPEIAEKRIRRFFTRTILMSRSFLTGVEYDGIVVPSLGDTVSGDIHEELRETNGLSNYDAILFAIPLIEEGLALLADEFGRVHVPCVPGNHPRDSRKPRFKQRSAHNADTFIFKLIRNNLRNDDRITFDIPDSLDANFEVYGTKFRIEHGDEAKGGSGIQGAMLPIALMTHRRRKQAQTEGHPFDVLLIGHWHQLMSMPAKGFIVNGAGKGYDEYARGKGFEPEQPQQALLVVTPEHGISVQAPLFVANRGDEGW